MKKTIVIFVLLFTLILAGGLYGTIDQLDEGKTVTAGQVYMSQFPDPMPDVILDPMPGFPLPLY